MVEVAWSKILSFCKFWIAANFISLAALKNLKKGEVIVPPLTWPSDIMAVINNGFKPKFVDVNLQSLSMNNDQIKKSVNKNTVAVFLTHAQGFNGLTYDLVNF